jgi:hypothetical protein
VGGTWSAWTVTTIGREGAEQIFLLYVWDKVYPNNLKMIEKNPEFSLSLGLFELFCKLFEIRFIIILIFFRWAFF